MTKTREVNDVNSRRTFLKSGAVAAAVGAATIAMPNVARAQEAVTFKFQSTWPCARQ
jgi:TRAP-type mannitol/chloroaromatic compound transport system substrate-binding protein